MNVQELAAKSAAEIRRRGWYQGNFGQSRIDQATCPVCVAGAANVVLHNTPFSSAEAAEQIALYRMIEERTGAKSTAAWNDDPERTVDDVLNLLDSISAGK